VSWAWWDWPLTWLTNHHPSVLWCCWLGYVTRKVVSEMTYSVSSGTLNTTIPYRYHCLTNHHPSVLWCCWLGYVTRKVVSEMTYSVSSGTLKKHYYTIPLSLFAVAPLKLRVPNKDSLWKWWYKVNLLIWPNASGDMHWINKREIKQF